MVLYFSTDGIKPALPAASISNGDGVATDSINVGPTTPGQTVIFDRILASDLPIGDSPSPTISAIPDQSIAQDSSSDALPFLVDEVDTPADSLTVSGSSSNPTLIPDENISFAGSGSNRTVTIIPAAGQSGAATISVMVSDGSLIATNNFAVNVTSTANPVLTVTANSVTRTYGDLNPDLTGSITGLQDGDDITANYSTSANESSAVGNYAITITLDDPQGKLTNYTVVIHAGMLQVTAAPLTINIDNQQRLYGASNPPLTGTISGLQNGDDISATYSATANESSSVGNYPITASFNDPQGRLTNYTVIISRGELNITPAPLTVTIDNQTRLYGAPNPPLTGTISGVQNSDVITTTYRTAAGPASPVGKYTISCSLDDPDSKLTNYVVSTNLGTLSVLSAGFTSIQFVDSNARVSGTGEPGLSYTIQASSDLSDWQDIGTATADSDGLLQFQDLDTANFINRFYRAISKSGS